MQEYGGDTMLGDCMRDWRSPMARWDRLSELTCPVARTVGSQLYTLYRYKYVVGKHFEGCRIHSHHEGMMLGMF